MAAVEAVRAQRLENLARANARRAEFRAVKRDIWLGKLDVVAALDDPRAARLHVPALLLAARRVGDVKVRRVLLLSRVSPSRRVGELTLREREALVEALAVVGIVS